MEPGITTRPLGVFLKFGYMPVELRLLVWAFALTPRLVRLSSSSSQWHPQGHAAPAIAHVCSESRSVACRSGRILPVFFYRSRKHGRTWFDPVIDVLYFCDSLRFDLHRRPSPKRSAANIDIVMLSQHIVLPVDIVLSQDIGIPMESPRDIFHSDLTLSNLHRISLCEGAGQALVRNLLHHKDRLFPGTLEKLSKLFMQSELYIQSISSGKDPELQRLLRLLPAGNELWMSQYPWSRPEYHPPLWVNEVIKFVNEEEQLREIVKEIQGCWKDKAVDPPEVKCVAFLDGTGIHAFLSALSLRMTWGM